MDILGDALLDFHNGTYHEDIKTFLSIHPDVEVIEDILPLPYLFRDFDAMPDLEQEALNHCRGTVLDIGCGAGNHSLYLQKKGLQVAALDSSAGAIRTCQARGINSRIHSSFTSYTEGSFDTLLLLMNGIGIAGTMKNLDNFFTHFKKLLNPRGQVLLDSSDLIYMFEQDDDGGHWLPARDTYYGEVHFSMAYKQKKGAVFPWLYLDFNSLKEVANKHDFNCEIVSEGEHYDYLARLSMK